MNIPTIDEPITAAAAFPRYTNTVEISGEAIASLDRWYIAAGINPKADGTYNKPSKEHRK